MSDGESIADLVRLLMEDRQRQDKQATAEKQQMMAQMEILQQLVERANWREESPARTEVPADQEKVKLTKLSDQNNIEAYLTTFERVMTAHGVDEERWTYKLAPQLTGWAQQAYAALPADLAGTFAEVKAAILRRYDINEETYRQRFRSAAKQSGETYRELATRVWDLASKWTRDCGSQTTDIVITHIRNVIGDLIAFLSVTEVAHTHIYIYIYAS